MRTRKRPATVEGKGRVPTPTIVGSLSYRKATVSDRHVPDGTPWALDLDRAEKALDAMTGTTLRDRQLIDLDDGLRRAAEGGGPAADVLTSVMRRAPSSEQVQLAADYLSALRRSPGKSRGQNSRATCLYRLALALGIPAESHGASPARALAKTLQRARRRLRLPE